MSTSDYMVDASLLDELFVVKSEFLDQYLEDNQFLWGPEDNNNLKKSPGHESQASDCSLDMDVQSPTGSLRSESEDNGNWGTIDFASLVDDDDDSTNVLSDLIKMSESQSEINASGTVPVQSIPSTAASSRRASPSPLGSVFTLGSPEPTPLAPGPVFMVGSPESTGSIEDDYQVHVKEENIQQNVSRKPKPAVKVVKVIEPQPIQQSRKATRSSREVLEEEIDETLDKNKKNAIQARLNRQKKKMYIQSLEHQVEGLTKENSELKCMNETLQTEKKDLEMEVRYLKSVLANQSTLSKLLSNIENVSSVNLSTSFTSRKRPADVDHDYSSDTDTRKRSRLEASTSESVSGGVCLHVHQDNVSLEFCAKCANMAGGSTS